MEITKTYLVNLDKNPDRLAFMERQFGALGIGYERFPAVYGRALTADQRKEMFASTRSLFAMRRRMSDGEIGCALSHLGVYRRMVDGNILAAMIFEDDVIIDGRFPSALARVESVLDAEKPQVYLFSAYRQDGAENKPEEIRPVRALYCADGYVITLAAAKLLLKVNYPVNSVADNFKRWRRYHGLELYQVLPATVRQDNDAFGSNLSIPKKLPWLPRQLAWLVDRLLLLCERRTRYSRERTVPTGNVVGQQLKAFVINMDYNPGRLAHMRRQLGRFPFEFVRVHGITPEEGASYGLKGWSCVRSFIANRRRLLPGQIGCTYSHLWIYHQIIEQNLPAALVFEDDVSLDERFGDRVETVMRVLDSRKPQLYLFSAVEAPEEENAKEGIRRIYHSWGADAYLITQEAAKLIIAKNEPVLVVCDTMKRFARYFGLELFRVFPITAHQSEAEFASDVPQATKPVGWVRGILGVLDWILIKLTGR